MQRDATHLKLFLFVMFALLFTGCERPTKVRLQSTNGLVFALSGSGSVAAVTVMGPRYRDEASSPDDRRFAIWMIVPAGGILNGTQISRLNAIKYGEAPPGYKQLIPANGESPQPIAYGQTYFLQVETMDAVGFRGYFLRQPKAAEFVHLDGPCFRADPQRWTRVPCSETK